MTDALEQQYETRKMVLAAVAQEVRQVVLKVDAAELTYGSMDATINAVDQDWHVSVMYNREQAFVQVTGHVHTPVGEQGEVDLLQLVFGQRVAFDFNCPVDWVPSL